MAEQIAHAVSECVSFVSDHCGDIRIAKRSLESGHGCIGFAVHDDINMFFSRSGGYCSFGKACA